MDIITIEMSIATLIILLFPFALALFINKKAYGKLYVFLIGIAGFLIANYGLNSLIGLISGGAVDKLFDTNELLASVLSDLQQSFVEEIMRFLLMLFLMKNCLTRENALMYAAGHGGAEMFIRGLSIAAGVLTAIKTPEDSPFLDMPFFSPFLFPLLYIFIFCLHIGLSYMVYRAVKDRKYWMAALAMLLHFAANICTVLEFPLIGLVGPLAVIVGLLIYTKKGYSKEAAELY